MTDTHKIYENEPHESLNDFLDRAFAELAKSIAAQEEEHTNSSTDSAWSQTFEATDENLAMLKNDDIIRINKNSPGMEWGAYKEAFKESGLLAFQIFMKKQKAENFFFLDTENGQPSYLGKFYSIEEAYEQSCIVHPDDEGVVVTIGKITDILKEMEEMIRI